MGQVLAFPEAPPRGAPVFFDEFRNAGQVIRLYDLPPKLYFCGPNRQDLLAYRVVAFRPPKALEFFIHTPGIPAADRASFQFVAINKRARFIVEPIRS